LDAILIVEIRNPRMGAVIAGNAALEMVASDFGFTEGPIWRPVERHLTFSDIPNGQILRWSATAGIEIFRMPSNKANGNAYDRRGYMISWEHASSSVTWMEASSAITTLASRWDGKELNSPNDVVVGRDGAIWFTDPTYGRIEYFGVPREQDLDFQGVYRIAPDGSLNLVADDFGQPNGICFSLDQRSLFINDKANGHIRRFEVMDDGTLSGGAVWAATVGDGAGAPDGMKIDSAGNLFCTGPGGVYVFAPGAAVLGVIHTLENTANFTWGDDDLKSLYLTASTSLYRIRTEIAGVDLFR
jgi:gluconolactonase